MGRSDSGRPESPLAINEAVYGPEHPEVAITLGNLGIVQQQLGEFEAARASQQRALAINEAVYGPEHPEVAITLTNLGNVQRQLGEFAAARASQQRALAINEAVYGPEHPEVARTLTNLGNVQQQLGELEAARECAQRAVAIFERSLGPEHPHTATARALLAGVRSTQPQALTRRERGRRRRSGGRVCGAGGSPLWSRQFHALDNVPCDNEPAKRHVSPTSSSPAGPGAGVTLEAQPTRFCPQRDVRTSTPAARTRA